MINLDNINQKKTDIMAALSAAIKSNDTAALQKSMNDWQEYLTESITAEANGILGAADSTILAARGVRQLTSSETKFYDSFITAAKQEIAAGSVITGIGDALPETVIEAVFEDMKQNHPLLDVINFQNTTAVTKLVLNKKGEQSATWDVLNTPITKQLDGEIEVISMTLAKLTAYMFVTFDMLDLGPAWIDRYVRETLSEALAVALETAMVDGNGLNQPVGMTRNFTGSLDSSGYSRKTATKVTAFDKETYGTLLSTLATNPNGGTRTVSEVILIVNPVDYFTKVMPATTVLAPDGTYRNDVFPFPTKVIQSVGVPANHAVIGLAKRYFMGIGTAKGGKLEYDDSYKYLEDLRTYKIKLYGTGKPLDTNAFIYLDISGVKDVLPTFKVVNETTTTGADGSSSGGTTG